MSEFSENRWLYILVTVILPFTIGVNYEMPIIVDHGLIFC